MKVIRHLDKNDLVYVLADYFKVNKENVDLIPYPTIEGYGMNEHYSASVRAEITLIDNADVAE